VTPSGLCYLATPYSLTESIDRAFGRACRVAAHLNMAGITCFSPIAHGHAIARCAGIDPKNPAVFDRLNKHMLDICPVLIVVLMEGWRQSDGIKEEVAFFEKMHKPIYDCDPQSLRLTPRKEAVSCST
jgi:hypothetical protein